METFAVKLENSGRILLPAKLRHQLGLLPGEDVLIRVDDDDSVSVMGNRVAAVRRLQRKYADLAPGRSLADELVEERHADAERGE